MSTKVLITLDLKKNRIRIFKSTLELLGRPRNIHILVNPADRKLIIRPTVPDKKASLKINYKTVAECEFYSRQLIEHLSALLPQNDPEFSYRISGRLVPEQGFALFDIDTATAIESPPDDENTDTVRSNANEY
ncbi:MAG: hypothetical protein K6E62_11415 [Lachnospiraceae bacterium]|nr:hypothetical protein [Lachnospiraceae bacterium]